MTSSATGACTVSLPGNELKSVSNTSKERVRNDGAMSYVFAYASVDFARVAEWHTRGT